MALEEHDISLIRDQLSSLVTSIESRIDARFSQVVSNISNSNSSLSTLREEVRSLSQRNLNQIGESSSRRPSGLPIPVHQGGYGHSGGIPASMRFPEEAASLLNDNAQKVGVYAKDLLSASSNIGEYIKSARSLNSELKALLQISRRGEEGDGAASLLREYASSSGFQDNLKTLEHRIQGGLNALNKRIILPNVPYTPMSPEELSKTQAEFDFQKTIERESLPGRFDANKSASENIRELEKSIGVTVGVDKTIPRRFITEESANISFDRFLKASKENPELMREYASTRNLELALKGVGIKDRVLKEAREFRLDDYAEQMKERLSLDNMPFTAKALMHDSGVIPADYGKLVEATEVPIIPNKKPETAIDMLATPEVLSSTARTIRGLTSYARERIDLGNPDERVNEQLKSLYAEFSGEKGLEKTLTDLRGRRAELEEKMHHTQKPLNEEESAEFDALTAKINELIPAISGAGKLFQESNQKTATSIAGAISSVVAALSVQQFMMMRFVSQPYQYETVPALGAMGNTGMMGDVLSGSFGAQESVLQSYREFGATAAFSLGGLAGGALGGLRFGLPGAIIGGVAGSLAGGTLGIFNQDSIANFLAGDMDNRAFQAELGRRMLDGQRFSSEYLMPTMQARINLGLDNRVDAAGNPITSASILNSFASEGALSLGYDPIVVAQLIGAGLSTMRPDLSPSEDESAINFVNTIAELEGFGVSKEAGIGLLSTLSAAGSEDYRESLARLAFSTSQDGELTNYTMNVLVPALAKVVESRSIQNISKNSELVERETASLFAFFKNSDTNLGKMLGANPEVMNRVFDMLNQVSETALNDPALMLFLNRMGVSFKDVMQQDPRTLLAPLELFSNYADYNVDGTANLDSMATYSSLAGFLQSTGIGVSTGTLNIASEMFSAMQQSRMTGADFVGYEDYMERMRAEDPQQQLIDVFNQFNVRMNAIAGSEGADVTRNIVTETTMFFDLMTKNADSIRELQASVQTILGDSAAIGRNIAAAGISILEKLSQVTGVDIDTTELKRSYIGSYATETQRRESIEGLDSTYISDIYSAITENEMGDTTWSSSPQGGLQIHNSLLLSRMRAENEYEDAGNLIPLTDSAAPMTLAAIGVNINNAKNHLPGSRRGIFGLGGLDQNAFGNMSGGSLEVSINGNVNRFFTRDEIQQMFPNDPSKEREYGNYVAFMALSELRPTERQFNQDENLKNEYFSAKSILSQEWGTVLDRGWATGGYTGTGTRLDPVGVVHGGEYVISDNNVGGNFQTLQRIQAGEKMDISSPFSTNTTVSNETIRVTLEFSNTNPEEIIEAARMSARAMLREERII